MHEAKKKKVSHYFKGKTGGRYKATEYRYMKKKLICLRRPFSIKQNNLCLL